MESADRLREETRVVSELYDSLHAAAEHRVGWLRKHEHEADINGLKLADYSPVWEEANNTMRVASHEFNQALQGDIDHLPSGYQLRKFQEAVSAYGKAVNFDMDGTDYNVSEDLD